MFPARLCVLFCRLFCVRIHDVILATLCRIFKTRCSLQFSDLSPSQKKFSTRTWSPPPQKFFNFFLKSPSLCSELLCMTDKSLSYVNYYATKAEAIACVKTLPFGGVIQLQNGWYHVWQQN
jgi:hypothetical protein